MADRIWGQRGGRAGWSNGRYVGSKMTKMLLEGRGEVKPQSFVRVRPHKPLKPGLELGHFPEDDGEPRKGHGHIYVLGRHPGCQRLGGGGLEVIKMVSLTLLSLCPCQGDTSGHFLKALLAVCGGKD